MGITQNIRVAKRKQKIIVVLGPTATGKSALAVELAKKFDGEVISADSRQVYKGLNIGTGKITRKEMQSVPHHLLDVANPKRRFTIVEYQKLARQKIADILSHGRIPIICGGTGFYISAVVDGVVLPDVPPDEKLRTRLKTKTPETLLNMLLKLDSHRAREIDPHNSRRLIRAIEIARALGRVPAVRTTSPYDPLFVGLTLPPAELKNKILIRLLNRIKEGMLAEAKRLHKAGLSWKRMEELGLEYRYLALHLQNKMPKEETTQKLSTEIWRYAKRQLTWFKRDNRTKWFSPQDTKHIELNVKTFLKDFG